LHELAFIKKNLKKWMKPTRVSTPQKILFYSKSYSRHVPKGQVLILSPWNYPFQLLFSPLIGAIAAGNTVVLKPSEYAVHVAQIVEKIIEEVFPEKYVAIVQGGADTAKNLLKLDWDLVFFTGSTVVGKKIAEAAAKNLTPVVLELGGKCPAIVHRDANLRVAARRIAWGKLINTGQTCVAPDYLLVHSSVKQKLLKLLVIEIENMLGRNFKETAAYGRIINSQNFDRLNTLLENTNIYYGGNRDRDELFIAPTIIDNVNPNHPLMKEEIFGPILPVLTYEEFDEAVRFVKRREPPLAIYQFTRSNTIFDQMQRHTRSGAILKNETIMHLSNLRLPFGGVRQSGSGRYHGKFSFETFSDQRSVLKHSTFFDPAMRYPPYTAKKWNIIKKLLP
jgi:aldehyde dehydrogenase (NAD+)